MKNYRNIFVAFFIFLFLVGVAYSEKIDNKEISFNAARYQNPTLERVDNVQQNVLAIEKDNTETNLEELRSDSDNSPVEEVREEVSDEAAALEAVLAEIERVGISEQDVDDGAIIESTESLSTYVGFLDLLGEERHIWRNPDESLTFTGHEGRTVPFHDADDWNLFYNPNNADIGIQCPWNSVYNPNTLFNNCWLIYDDGSENNGAVKAITYEPAFSQGIQVQMNRIPPYTSYSHLWGAAVPSLGGYLFYSKLSQRYFFVVPNPATVYFYTEPYDSYNGGNFRGAPNTNYDFWSIFPESSSWDPSNPPNNYDAIIQNWNLAQAWDSVGPVVPLTSSQSNALRYVARFGADKYQPKGSGGGSRVSADVVKDVLESGNNGDAMDEAKAVDEKDMDKIE